MDVDLSRLHTRLRGRLTVDLPTPLLFHTPLRRLALLFEKPLARPLTSGSMTSTSIDCTLSQCCFVGNYAHRLHCYSKTIAALQPRVSNTYSSTSIRYTRVLHNNVPSLSCLNITQPAQRRRGTAQSLPTVTPTGARLCARCAIGQLARWICR